MTRKISVRGLQSAVANRGNIRKRARNTTLDLRKPWMSRVALDRKQIPKKFILASGGEEEKNKFMSSSKLGLRSQFTSHIRLPKGLSPVDGQRNSILLDLSSPRFRMVWSSHSGEVRQ